MQVRKSAVAAFSALLLAAGTAPIAGCGGDDNTNSANNDGTNGNNDNGGNDGVVADSIGMGGPMIRRGVNDPGPDMEWLIGAGMSFYSTPQRGNIPLALAGTTRGCTLTMDPTAPAVDPGNTNNPGPQLVSAGDIDFAIGDKTGQVKWDDTASVPGYGTFTPDDGNEFGSFVGGEDITVTAATGGVTVPPFSVTFKAPSVVDFTSGLIAMTTVKANSNLVVTWAPGAASEIVQFKVYKPSQLGDTTPQPATTCLFDANAGTGTVPADMITALGVGTVWFNAFSETAARATAGANKVDLTAIVTFASGTVTIE